MGKNAKPETNLADSFESSVRNVKNWIEEQRNIDVIYVSYAEVIENPSFETGRINAFLGGGLDETKMTEAVDAGLRREVSVNIV